MLRAADRVRALVAGRAVVADTRGERSLSASLLGCLERHADLFDAVEYNAM